jgi:hypothetical protein
VLGVQRAQVPVFDLFDRFDVGYVSGVIVGAHDVIAAHLDFGTTRARDKQPGTG